MRQGWRSNSPTAGLPKTRLERALLITDLALKCVTIIAIVVGGIWAAGTFLLFRSEVENVNLTLSTQQIPYGELKLLVIHVRPKNLGKVLSSPVTYRVQVEEISGGLPQGSVIERSSLKPIESVDMLRNHPDGYEMEPGVEYDDVEIVPLRKGITVLVTAEFGFEDGSAIDVHEVALIK